MRLCFVLLLISLNCVGQHLPELWNNKNVKRPLSFVSIREADITWAKRVWRTIDLREKLNHPLRYPLIAHKKKSSLFDVLKKALLSGLITPLEIGKDEFLTNIPADSIVKLLIM